MAMITTCYKGWIHGPSHHPAYHLSDFRHADPPLSICCLNSLRSPLKGSSSLICLCLALPIICLAETGRVTLGK